MTCTLRRVYEGENGKGETGMTRKELSWQIANELLDNGCLNEADYPSTEALVDEVGGMVLDRLGDYIILKAMEVL
jgi:hypothetical protein